MPRVADGRDMSHATFLPPDLGSFCRLDELGLQVVGQRLEPGCAVLACRVVETDEFARWCRRCGCEAAPRDSVTRRLAHEPPGWRPDDVDARASGEFRAVLVKGTRLPGAGGGR